MSTIPNEIQVAVNALLKPYGACYNPVESPKTKLKKYLTLKEASEYTGLEKWTLSRRIKSGQLKACKLDESKRGTVLIAIKDLEDFLQSKLYEC